MYYLNKTINMKRFTKILIGCAAVSGIAVATGFVQFDYVIYEDGKVSKTNRKDIKVGDTVESIQEKEKTQQNIKQGLRDASKYASFPAEHKQKLKTLYQFVNDEYMRLYGEQVPDNFFNDLELHNSIVSNKSQ